MSFPIRFWATVLACLLLFQFSTAAEAKDCKYEKEINLTLDLRDSESLTISAFAGDLEVDGVKGSHEAVIRGLVCASTQEWLESSGVETDNGRNASIEVVLPDEDSKWTFFRNHYKYIDLQISVPADMALDVSDSSGDASFENIGPLNIRDSSGSIIVEYSSGPVTVRDSSGEIEIAHVNGDVTIESDSSGSIEISDVDGHAIVKKDSSGEIEFDRIKGNAIVGQDSSGSIIANDVDGDFRVERDGSGSIRSSNIGGEVDTPSSK